MTDVSTPAEVNASVDNKSTAHAIHKAGGHSGYVVNGIDISQFYPELTTTGINGFAHASSTGLDITLDGGEAFVSGWLCRDRQTTITLPASATTRVCVGFNPDAVLTAGQAPTDNDNVILDVESAFGNGAPKLPLYEITTDATTILSVTDVRPMGPSNANSTMFASATDHDALRAEHDSLATDYNSFRSAGGTIGGDVTIQGASLNMPNVSGNAGLILTDGSRYSTYQGWTTIYSYSNDGGLGVRFRNPNSGGDLFNVASDTGNATLKGLMTQQGRSVVDSSAGHYEIQKNGTDGAGIINFKT